MNSLGKMVCVAVVIGLSAFTSQGAVIDDFSDALVKIDAADSGGSTHTASQSGLSVLGGRRDTTVESIIDPDADVESAADVTVEITGGEASLESGNQEIGRWLFEYGLDGMDEDLSAGSAFGVFFTKSQNSGSSMTIHLSDLDSSDSVSIALSFANDILETILFSAFTGIDFSHITYIALEIEGAEAGDFGISEFTVIPAPAALPAGLLLLGAFSVLRRRRMII
jgi:hypothetical protein